MPQWGFTNETLYGILVAGLPLFMEFEAYNSVIYPGMAVMMNGEGFVTPCTNGANPVGIADIAMASQTGRGSRRKADCDDNVAAGDDNAYAVGDQVKVISGPIIVKLILGDDEDVVAGEKLQCDDDLTAGMVQNYDCSTTADPCAIIAESLETMSTAAAACAYIMAKLLI